MSEPNRRRLTTDIQLRFADTDALGHVNNAAFATFAESGRLAFLAGAGRQRPPLILARLAIDFRRQVRLDDRVAITTEVARLGERSITLRQVVTANDDVAAEIDSVVVWFDYAAQRSAPIPEAVRRGLGD
jgi:acyl-CoA thioester hydrolase